MYTRKIKLMTGKKKGKPAAPPGSVWGPRIALAEKEKALTASLSSSITHPETITTPTTNCTKGRESKGVGGLISNARKQNSYCINNPLPTGPHRNNNINNNPLPQPPSTGVRSNYKKVSISSISSHTTGSSSGNNYIYNYARKASSAGGSGNGHKSFFLAHPPSSRSISSNQTSYGGGSTYMLGSNSGSHATLSTVGETMSQPLTLIIPPASSEGFIKVGSDYGDDGGIYNVMLEREQDSFPSTKTYCSSRDEEESSGSSGNEGNPENDVGSTARTISGHVKMNRNRNDGTINLHAAKLHGNSYSFRNPLPSKSEQIFANSAINLGILKVSTTQPIIHHRNEYHIHPNTQQEQVDIVCNQQDVVTIGLSSYTDKRFNMRTERMKNNEEEDIPDKETLSPIYDLRKICNSNNNKNNSIGSTISSLAQGINRVYVPMESLPRSKSAAVLNASLEFDPDLAKLVKESQGEISNDNGEEDPIVGEQDPDNDSLLESFDSVMFKPRDEQKVGSHRGISSPSSSCSRSSNFTPSQPQSPNVTITNILCNETFPASNRNDPGLIMTNYDKTSRNDGLKQPKALIVVPPPLPPKNPSMLKVKPKLKFNDNMFANIARRNNNSFKPSKVDSSSSSSPPPSPSASQREINIRNAVENLENIIRPQSTSTTATPSPQPSDDKDYLGLKKPHKSPKRVTLTLPNECLAGGQELLLMNNIRGDTDTEIDAYSSTFLTCGHVLKEDNYSTLSSTHSPRTETHDDEYLDQSSSSPEVSPTQTNPCSSGGEQSPSGEQHKNRSVLQQLRELSILIGSGGSGTYVENDKLFSQLRKQKDVCGTELDNNKTPVKSFRLHEEDPTRKLSDATDNSADSGKGTESGSTEVSISDSSPKSIQSSPDSLQLKVAANKRQHNKRNCHPASGSPCVFRSDCNECLMFNKPVDGFKKPENSSEICGKSDITAGSNKSLKKQSSKKSTPSKLILRRKSSRSSKSSSKPSIKPSRKKSKNLILEYCECSSCDCDINQQQQENVRQSHPISSDKSSLSPSTSGENARKISTTSSSSGNSSVKLNRSVAFRSSSRSNLNRPLSSCNTKSSPLSNSELSTNGLFTIEEEENMSLDSKLRNNKCCNSSKAFSHANVNHDHSETGSGGDIDVKNGPHWHPNCWLADPSGWSDLESLYSLNVKNNDQPVSINGECWTCWAEISEIKRNSENPNGTVDRTKRMFIWLNKRHKEFQAPWWEAKKQASIRWVMTKALVHVPKEYVIDPFRESKKSKPIKYRLRDEVIKGLVSGKLYTLALANLYRQTLNGHAGSYLCHWEIIKILSRRGVYMASPSDMKLTEGTLRQKPIRIAAHIALIEAIMCLYSKEILARDRINATLYTFGCTIKSDTNSPEKLVIAWINAAVMTLKSYIVSTRNHQLSPEKQSRWLQVPKVGEIRDLCDGIGICSLLAIYCSNDLKPVDISVPEPGETLTIYDSISNHTLVQKLCEELFPETIYHLCVTDFLYIHGYMKQNILCFLVDLFLHLEVNPIVRVNRLTHVPIRVDLA